MSSSTDTRSAASLTRDKEGKLDPGTRAMVAKVTYGVLVRKGAAKPDISSVEAFKHAFLNARSIAHTDFGSGARVLWIC